MFSRFNIAVFIAFLFHFSGAIGILFSPYKDWFINLTPLNLIIMVGLIFYTQPKSPFNFWLFAIICFITGMVVEIIGVNTHLLFGDYTYGTVMGYKIMGVPLLIGLQWFVTIYCCGTTILHLQYWLLSRTISVNMGLYQKYHIVLFLIDASLMATFFDYIIEPIASRLGYWHWNNNLGTIPSYNYLCWFGISGLLLLLFQKLHFPKGNLFVIHLFIIQLLFFLSLAVYI